jgi:glucose/arabinose dehydrogenase
MNRLPIRLFLLCSLALLLGAPRARGEILPGFRVELLAPTAGFCSSLAADSAGTVYYTTTKGNLYRLEGSASVLVAHVTTNATGNSGLLGMALLDDHTAVVHYTRPDQTFDVVSTIDLGDGSETLLHEFVGDITEPGRGTPNEHHGGNPVIGDDGDVYVGIGDYGAFNIAADPRWNAGKIFRIDRSGNATQLASGFRNPFDLGWDALHKRLVVPDNGDLADDEINLVDSSGGFFGWPFTAGTAPPFNGSVPPRYVFPTIVAPTGLAMLSGRNPMLRTGFLLGAFVTRGIYYVANVDAIEPILLFDHVTPPVVDVTEAKGGEILFTTGMAIYRLGVPLRGDCNANGALDLDDLVALERELGDGGSHSALKAQEGNNRASWGCDADLDGLITPADRIALWRLITNRGRAVRP